MPSLATLADVKAIMEVPGGVTDAQLTSFIGDAHIIVSEDLAGKGLSDARLVAIEKYLAAHFAIQLTERGGLTMSRVGDARDDYTKLDPQGQGTFYGLGLTRYGQQAILLDTSGTLKKLASSALSAQFRLV